MDLLDPLLSNIKPPFNRRLKTAAAYVIGQCCAESRFELVGIIRLSIGIGNPKIAELAFPFPADLDLETFRVICHRAGLKQTEPMPEAAMKITRLEKIPKKFQRLHRFLSCLRWESVH